MNLTDARTRFGPHARISRGWAAAAVVIGLLAVFSIDRVTGSAPAQHLYYLPIMLAAVAFETAGGTLAALCAVLLYHLANPHLLRFSYGESDVIQMVLFVAVGLVPARLTRDAARLRSLAATDDLTGLSNLRAFEARLLALVGRSRERQSPIAMLVLDVDRLKLLNDEHGHLTGAEAVRTVGHMIAARLPVSASACRYGGDEFAVAIPDCPLALAWQLADDLRHAVSRCVPVLVGRPFPVGTLSISIGVATLAPDGLERDAASSTSDAARGQALFQEADAALYRAKAAGRNQVRTTSDSAHNNVRSTMHTHTTARTRPRPGTWHVGGAAVLCLLGALAAPPSLYAQGIDGSQTPTNFLRLMNASVEALTARVSPSVVQVLVTAYGPVDSQAGDDSGPVIGPQHSLGSGAIIDKDGYIITNAHVVAGARRVQVVLHADNSAAAASNALAAEAGRTVEARIVGTATDLDLALLKVDVPDLRPLPLADYGAIRQGELVFAFGSPEGLRNSVTMGLVSSIARQPDPDRPTIYVQTDAPINPGSSGGPLINVDGELVGLNTFILSDSGGSQGLGFAIPSAVVAAAYPQLRKFGHLHRGMVGINLQSITPALVEGLGLTRTSGVIVSDVMPDGPSDAAGVEIGDVVATVNGRPVASVPMLSLELSIAAAGETVRFGLVRGASALDVNVVVANRPQPIDDVADLADPEKNAIPELGIIGVDVSDETGSLLPGLRKDSGVFVAARTRLPSGALIPLAAGDVIHSVNTIPIRSADGLRVLLAQGKGGRRFVLQVERDGQLRYVACELY